MHIRVTKEFRFEMAHALLHHDGLCKNIHGHSYSLSITLKGKPMQESGNPKDGMVMDFSDLKKIVQKLIVEPFDHALVLNKQTPEEYYFTLTDQKLILVDYQPTCENLLIYIAQLLEPQLPPEVKLHHLMLRETATSYAEWYQEDNTY